MSRASLDLPLLLFLLLGSNFLFLLLASSSFPLITSYFIFLHFSSSSRILKSFSSSPPSSLNLSANCLTALHLLLFFHHLLPSVSHLLSLSSCTFSPSTPFHLHISPSIPFLSFSSPVLSPPLISLYTSFSPPVLLLHPFLPAFSSLASFLCPRSLFSRPFSCFSPHFSLSPPPCLYLLSSFLCPCFPLLFLSACTPHSLLLSLHHTLLLSLSFVI